MKTKIELQIYVLHHQKNVKPWTNAAYQLSPPQHVNLLNIALEYATETEG